MILKSISLTNFKNIASAQLDFSAKVNCLLGNNGMGKSNLLDAIYFLSFAKSFTRVTDSMLITRGESFSILQAQYLRRDTDEDLSVGLRKDRRKSFKRGGKEYRRISEHIGLFPLVMVSPSDLSLISDSSEERRRFIDMIISQGDSSYLEALMRYNQSLEQRNRMLRDGFTDTTLYEAVEMTMDMAASEITRKRERTVEELKEIFAANYRAISGSDEVPEISYKRSDRDYSSLADAIEHARSRDAILKYTTVGPHRDDLIFTLDGMPVRQTASQGQMKTFTIGLRFAQYEFLRKITTMDPLLLLDDIFDKLDAERVGRIISMVSGDNFGQIFITDTNRKHLDDIMINTGPDFRIWHVDKGSFISDNGYEEN